MDRNTGREVKLRPGWRDLPKKNGKYFVVNHCGQIDTHYFSDGKWGHWEGCECKLCPICPTCDRFKWLEFEEGDLDMNNWIDTDHADIKPGMFPFQARIGNK